MQVVDLNHREASSLAPQATRKPRLEARFARSYRELQDAQCLRAALFGAEYGVAFPDRIDRDRYDEFCEHLNVYDTASCRLVATTRLLSQERAREAGGFYSGSEFDLAPLATLPGRVLEIGRTCVHPDYRSGAAIAVLWSALADYLLDRGFSYLLGCASVSLRDGGAQVAALLPQLRRDYMVEAPLRVTPRRTLVLPESGPGATAAPPLLKAYLRMGCRIGGEPCWDPEFNCADVLVLLDVSAVAGRYAQRFLKAG